MDNAGGMRCRQRLAKLQHDPGDDAGREREWDAVARAQIVAE